MVVGGVLSGIWGALVCWGGIIDCAGLDNSELLSNGSRRKRKFLRLRVEGSYGDNV